MTYKGNIALINGSWCLSFLLMMMTASADWKKSLLRDTALSTNVLQQKDTHDDSHTVEHATESDTDHVGTNKHCHCSRQLTTQ